jgi:hypothetical protein
MLTSTQRRISIPRTDKKRQTRPSVSVSVSSSFEIFLLFYLSFYLSFSGYLFQFFSVYIGVCSSDINTAILSHLFVYTVSTLFLYLLTSIFLFMHLSVLLSFVIGYSFYLFPTIVLFFSTQCRNDPFNTFGIKQQFCKKNYILLFL